MRFRISYTFSFDFMRTVWWCPSCSIGNVWTFVELQLTALSALVPTQGTHKVIGVGLENYTGNFLMGKKMTWVNPMCAGIPEHQRRIHSGFETY